MQKGKNYCEKNIKKNTSTPCKEQQTLFAPDNWRYPNTVQIQNK